MKNIFEKIKKVFFGIGMLLMYLPNKVLAVAAGDVIRDFDDDKYTSPEYGVQHVHYTSWERVLDVFRFIFLPIVLLIGLTIYFKKSKASKKKKIIVTICTVLVGALLYFILTSVRNKI